MVNASYLNQYLHHRPLCATQKYCICYNLNSLINQGKIIALSIDGRESSNRESILALKQDGAIATISPPEIEDNNIISERQPRYTLMALLQEEHQQPHIEEEEENDTSHDDSPRNTQTETIPSNSSSTRQKKF